MEKVPGCWEHLSMVWQALKESRTQKCTLASILLEIGNSYGSIPHKLIVFALRGYGVSPQWIRLVENYYKGIFNKSQGYSISHSLTQKQVLGIDIKGKYLPAAPFLKSFCWLVLTLYWNTLWKSKFLNLPVITPNFLCYVFSWMI